VKGKKGNPLPPHFFVQTSERVMSETENPGQSDNPSVYEVVGGTPVFRQIVDAFYAGVEQDTLLRPMYPEDLSAAREHLFLFLVQYWGGPPDYSAQRGHPRLRRRHFPFPIDEAARDAWMHHMTGALDGTGMPTEAREQMRAYFEDAASFLMNK